MVVPLLQSDRHASTYWLTRFFILRLLGIVYAVAFLAAANQVLPLIGSHGLLPIQLFIDHVRQALGTNSAGFARLPSMFWFVHSDVALVSTAWAGFALSCLVALGFANSILLTVLWLLYMSFVHIGQDWYSYGWETQLLETGFLAIFLAPFFDPRPFPRTPPSVVVIWLFRWLIFRILIGSALIKLRGDPAWRDLSALYYYFETQPIPNPLSRFFHFLPRPVLQAGTLYNFLAELIAPWFVFWPRIARHIAGGVIVAFLCTIAISGNLSFLNWLTVVPALACFDDSLWLKICPVFLRRWQRAAVALTATNKTTQVLAYALACIIVFLSIQPVTNMFSSEQIMNTSFDSLDLVNTYGAFGSIGRERFNVVFEGTNADFPGDEAQWETYHYKGLPTDLKKVPPQVAPYQLRLDWQMWFAAMGTPDQYPWTIHLIWKLLHNDPETVSLFSNNPFPKAPPRYIRAVLYRYRFAPFGEKQTWTREKLGLWLPPLSVNDQRLTDFLQAAGWTD